MNATHFDTLCSQAAISLNLSDPSPLSEGGLIHVNGVWLSATPIDQPFDGAAFVMDVGPLPITGRTAVLEAVLSQQTAWMGGINAHFYLSSDGSRLLLAATVPSQDVVTGEDLATTIRAWSEVVRLLRQTQLPLEVTT